LTDIVANAVAKGFACIALDLAGVFEISVAAAVAITVAILVTAFFAGVAAKQIDVGGYWSCGSVLIGPRLLMRFTLWNSDGIWPCVVIYNIRRLRLVVAIKLYSGFC
jgi:hypothetical protein